MFVIRGLESSGDEYPVLYSHHDLCYCIMYLVCQPQYKAHLSTCNPFLNYGKIIILLYYHILLYRAFIIQRVSLLVWEQSLTGRHGKMWDFKQRSKTKQCTSFLAKTSILKTFPRSLTFKDEEWTVCCTHRLPETLLQLSQCKFFLIIPPCHTKISKYIQLCCTCYAFLRVRIDKNLSGLGE